jgi:hypothetical protein
MEIEPSFETLYVLNSVLCRQLALYNISVEWRVYGVMKFLPTLRFFIFILFYFSFLRYFWKFHVAYSCYPCSTECMLPRTFNFFVMNAAIMNAPLKNRRTIIKVHCVFTVKYLFA